MSDPFSPDSARDEHEPAKGSSILIAGAGIFGLTAAWELRRRGWTVTVLDPGPIPRPSAASTDVSKIVRADYGADHLYTAMAQAALAGWDRWNKRWGGSLYHEDGFVVLASEPMSPGGFEYESFESLRRRGHPVERLTGIDRTRTMPAWSPNAYPDGYFNRRAGWVESAAVTARVADEARATGVRIVENATVGELLPASGHVTSVRTHEGAVHSADFVLIAAGAWTPKLLPHLGDVLWTTGQPVVHVEAGADPRWRAPTFPVWAADIARTGWYGFPALPNGALKIGHHGSGRRVDPDSPGTVPGDHERRVREFLREQLPALADAPIRESRLCLYCDSFDGDFLIDHDPGHRGLVVAAGDSGHGFKFAPVLGSLIADVIERRPNPWAPRFRWRSRGPDRREAARAEV
jgi:glycine/D-amino acid oxidase-like deaminating enzyme